MHSVSLRLRIEIFPVFERAFLFKGIRLIIVINFKKQSKSVVMAAIQQIRRRQKKGGLDFAVEDDETTEIKKQQMQMPKGEKER